MNPVAQNFRMFNRRRGSSSVRPSSRASVSRAAASASAGRPSRVPSRNVLYDCASAAWAPSRPASAARIPSRAASSAPCQSPARCRIVDSEISAVASNGR